MSRFEKEDVARDGRERVNWSLRRSAVDSLLGTNAEDREEENIAFFVCFLPPLNERIRAATSSRGLLTNSLKIVALGGTRTREGSGEKSANFFRRAV